jgi:hypothetical protein
MLNTLLFAHPPRMQLALDSDGAQYRALSRLEDGKYRIAGHVDDPPGVLYNVPPKDRACGIQ